MNPVVTLLESVTRPKRCNAIPVQEVLEGIRTGRWKASVENVRSLLASGQSDQAGAAKKKLPAVLFSGRFQPASDVGWKEHSGLVVLDFDKVGARLPALIELARSQPCVFAAFVSPSGEGLKVVVRTPTALDAERHRRTARLLIDWAAQAFAASPDNTPDPSRKCFVSYDPGLFVNPGPVEWVPVPDSLDREARSHGGREAEKLRGSRGVENAKPEPLVDLTWRGQPVAEAILGQELVPTKTGQTHDLLFKLARLGKAIEEERGSPLTKAERSELFRHWHHAASMTAPSSLRKSASEYRLEFLSVYDKARLPWGVDPIARAWELAKSEPLPPEAKPFEDSPMCQNLVALCFQLSKLANDQGCFFLSCYQAAKLLGVSHQHALTLLGGMVADGILLLDKKGKSSPIKGIRVANRYRWLNC